MDIERLAPWVAASRVAWRVQTDGLSWCCLLVGCLGRNDLLITELREDLGITAAAAVAVVVELSLWLTVHVMRMNGTLPATPPINLTRIG